jgi:hypothetical protein
VPEDVPADTGQADLHTDRFKDLLLNHPRVVATACDVGKGGRRDLEDHFLYFFVAGIRPGKRSSR